MIDEKDTHNLLQNKYGGEFVIEKKDTDLLEDHVRNALKEDPLVLAEVKRLIKTPDTFSNSIGNLYFYLKDREECQNCHGKLSLCKKKNMGYQYKLSYDKSTDSIIYDWKECSYLSSIMSIINRIYPCYIPYFETYNAFSKIVSDQSEKKPMADVSKLIFKDTVNEIHAFNNEKCCKGYVLHSINSKNISKNVLRAICFMFTKSNIATSYIQTRMFFEDLMDFNYSTKETAENYLKYIQEVPVLFLEGFDDFPYLTDAALKDYLYPLLKSRSTGHKITYFTITSSQSLSFVILRKFKNMDCYFEIQDLVDEYKTINIKDFDLD